MATIEVTGIAPQLFPHYPVPPMGAWLQIYYLLIYLFLLDMNDGHDLQNLQIYFIFCFDGITHTFSPIPIQVKPAETICQCNTQMMLSCGTAICDFTQLNNNSMPGAAISTDENVIK